MTALEQLGGAAREASSVLMTLSAGEKDRILEAIASVLEENAAAISTVLRP